MSRMFSDRMKTLLPSFFRIVVFLSLRGFYFPTNFPIFLPFYTVSDDYAIFLRIVCFFRYLQTRASTMPRTCSVKNCTADVKHIFKFPQANTDRERFLRWLAASGNPSLLSFSIKQLRTKGICEIHFESKYMLAKKLTTTAVPTLHLPDKIEVSTYKIVENNNIEYEPPRKRSKDNTTDFRFESDQQNILRYETESLDYTVFDADTENSPVDEILSTVHVNGKQGRTRRNAQEAKPTLVEENINTIHLQGVPKKTIVRKTKSLSSVRTNKQQTVGKMCTLCKAFGKAGMRRHLVKLHQALEENPSEDTKHFVRNQLQALTAAICKRGI